MLKRNQYSNSSSIEFLIKSLKIFLRKRIALLDSSKVRSLVLVTRVAMGSMWSAGRMVSTGECRNTSTWTKTSSSFNLSTGNPTIYKSNILLVGNAPWFPTDHVYLEALNFCQFSLIEK
jgi:hypothetical protein